MESQISLLCPQKPTGSPYPQPDVSSPELSLYVLSVFDSVYTYSCSFVLLKFTKYLYFLFKDALRSLD